MSVVRWLAVGVLAGAFASGCATAVGLDDNAGDDGGDAPAHDGGHEGGSLGEASTSHDGAGDTSSTGDDSATGDDGATEAAGDAGGTDANVPDTNVPDTNVPDTNIPDTNIPDTNIPDTNIPDTNVPDTNVPDTSTPDAGGCHALTSGFTPKYHAPQPRQPGSCTASQISGFYTACLDTSAGCNAWRLSNGTCDSCLTTNLDPAGTSWGPLLQYPEYISNDLGGCIYLDKGSSQSACAHDREYQLECSHYACDTTCAGATETDYSACVTAANSGICATYVSAVAIDCTAASTCYNGTDFASNFKQVAAVFCQ
jgi:hypothetical protein